MKGASIGNTIKTGRERRGWTQAKLAEHLGTRPECVSRWENNWFAPAERFIVPLCQALGLDAAALLSQKYDGTTLGSILSERGDRLDFTSGVARRIDNLFESRQVPLIVQERCWEMSLMVVEHWQSQGNTKPRR